MADRPTAQPPPEPTGEPAPTLEYLHPQTHVRQTAWDRTMHLLAGMVVVALGVTLAFGGALQLIRVATGRPGSGPWGTLQFIVGATLMITAYREFARGLRQ